jgi:hypothetical protein
MRVPPPLNPSERPPPSHCVKRFRHLNPFSPTNSNAMRTNVIHFILLSSICSVIVVCFQQHNLIRELTVDLKSAQADLDKQSRKDLVLVTCAASEDFEAVRELVGFVHFFRADNVHVQRVLIYGFDLTPVETREINIWRNVEFWDAYVTLAAGHECVGKLQRPPGHLKSKRFSKGVLLHILDLNLRKYKHVVFIHPRVVFTSRRTLPDLWDVLYRTGALYVTRNTRDTAYHALIQGYESGSIAANIFVSFELQCMRGAHCDDDFRQALSKAQEQMFTRSRQLVATHRILESRRESRQFKRFYCFILLRDDILYGRVTKQCPERKVASSQKTSIAIGMPTVSAAGFSSYADVAPLRIFLPSLLATVTPSEAERFELRVYIGFDEGDRFFDDLRSRTLIKSRMLAMIASHAAKTQSRIDIDVLFVRFPYSRGWVSYLWNGLFVQAMQDGAEYFYQVNDDLRLSSAGWLSFFVSVLQQNNDIGVAGPWDVAINGSILTQAFVSRKHYDIFGRLYPLDIKDWFSDNWLNDVYEPSQRFSTPALTAQNVNEKGTRYSICSKQPRYHEILQRGRTRLGDWLAHSHSTTDQLERLQAELRMGPIT